MLIGMRVRAASIAGLKRQLRTASTALSSSPTPIPRKRVILDAAKEVLKRAIEPNQNRLQGMGMNVLKFGSRFLHCGTLRLLIKPTYGRSVLVGIYPLPQSGIVEFAAQFQLGTPAACDSDRVGRLASQEDTQCCQRDNVRRNLKADGM